MHIWLDNLYCLMSTLYTWIARITEDFYNLQMPIFVCMYDFFLLFLGTSTDGEFEQLRRRGETRPLHIWQLAHDSHDSVSRMSKRTLLQMLEMHGGMVLNFL